MKIKSFNRAQTSIEVVAAFVAILLFLLGIIRIWIWGNNDLWRRQNDYRRSRDASGRWPIHQSQPLSDSTVFR
jgi:hypothetical protein